MPNKNGYIGVFDSGVGGISVLRELVRQMPGERFLYYGDSANAPYGTKSAQQVLELTLAAAKELLEVRRCKALVLACNTATAVAVAQLRAMYPRRIIVGIEPALKVAADRFPQGNVGIMATPVTLSQDKLLQLEEHFPTLHTHKIPAPGLVELIESGESTANYLQKLLAPYVGRLDALVLGCTHYPLVKSQIQKVLPDTLLVDGAQGTAGQTRRRLEQENLLRSGQGEVVVENSTHDPAMVALCMALLKEEV